MSGIGVDVMLSTAEDNAVTQGEGLSNRGMDLRAASATSTDEDLEALICGHSGSVGSSAETRTAQTRTSLTALLLTATQVVTGSVGVWKVQ